MWAGLERKRSNGELTAWQTMTIVNAIPFAEPMRGSVDSVNPYRARVKPKPISEFQNKQGWSMMFQAVLGCQPEDTANG